MGLELNGIRFKNRVSRRRGPCFGYSAPRVRVEAALAFRQEGKFRVTAVQTNQNVLGHVYRSLIKTFDLPECRSKLCFETSFVCGRAFLAGHDSPDD
jgi:hypothetical protein